VKGSQPVSTPDVFWRWLVFLVFLANILVGADAPDKGAGARPELSHVPVTLYPQFNWVGTALEDLFNVVTRPDDRIVIRRNEGLKAGFRSRDYRVRKEQVWLQTPTPLAVEGTAEQRQAGIGGFFLYLSPRPGLGVDLPSSFREDGRSFARGFKPLLQSMHTELENRGMELAAELDYHPSRLKRLVKILAPEIDIYVIFSGRLLTTDPEAYLKYVKSQAAWAREANASIQIEVNVTVGGTPEATALLVQVLADCRDTVDRFGIKFTADPKQLEGLQNLLSALRPEASEGPGG
jgi:hypothetical protein